MGGLGVKVQHFPLTLLVVLTTLTLPCERDYGINRQIMRDFIKAVNDNFRSSFNRFRDIACFVRREPYFAVPHSYSG